MTRITARVPHDLAESLDAAAACLGRSRAAVVRKALGCYLEDFDVLTVALERLRDRVDPVLDWDQVRASPTREHPRPLLTTSIGRYNA